MAKESHQITTGSPLYTYPCFGKCSCASPHVKHLPPALGTEDTAMCRLFSQSFSLRSYIFQSGIKTLSYDFSEGSTLLTRFVLQQNDKSVDFFERFNYKESSWNNLKLKSFLQVLFSFRCNSLDLWRDYTDPKRCQTPGAFDISGLLILDLSNLLTTKKAYSVQCCIFLFLT